MSDLANDARACGPSAISRAINWGNRRLSDDARALPSRARLFIPNDLLPTIHTHCKPRWIGTKISADVIDVHRGRGCPRAERKICDGVVRSILIGLQQSVESLGC